MKRIVLLLLMGCGVAKPPDAVKQSAVLIEDYRELHYAIDSARGVVCYRFWSTEGIACLPLQADGGIR